MKKFIKSLSLFVMLFVLASCSQSNGKLKYLPVQLVGSEMWSIVDVETGEVILKDEFKNCPSLIVNDVFYVMNGDGKYDFYNVNDVKKPLNKTSYKEVTHFSNGYALAVEDGKTISVINAEGKQVASMPANVKCCSTFSEDGVAIAQFTDDKCGLVDTKGKKLFDKTFDGIVSYNDGIAIVVKDGTVEDVTYTVIDKSGKELFSKKKSDCDMSSSVYSEDLIVVKKDDKCVALDKKGERKGTVGNSSSASRRVDNGLIVYYDGESYGLKDKDMNTLVRAKYDRLEEMPDGVYDMPALFVAAKGEMMGVIDKEDKEIVPFDQKGAFVLGEDRFLVGNEKSCAIVDLNNKDVSKDNFKNVSTESCYSVTSNYYDAEGAAKNLACYITANSCFDAKSGDVFKKFVDKANSAESSAGSYYVNDNEGGFSLAYEFEEPIAVSTPKYSTYEFWGSTYRYQSGYNYNYNMNSKIAAVRAEFDVSEYAVNSETRFVAAFEKELNKLGFKASTPGIYRHPKGAAISVGYEEGKITMLYVFNGKNLTKALERVPRGKVKTETRSTDYEEVDSIDADSTIVDSAYADSAAYYE